NNNQTVVTQIASSPIWDGIPSPLSVALDPAIITSNIGLTATTGQSIGRYGNNEDALIVGSSGRTILDGFPAYTAGATTTQTRLAQNEISAILGGISDDDWYSVNATEGQVLMFDTTTPGDGPGEFGNTLDPHIQLFDSSGQLIAEGTPLADGR